MLIPDVFEKHNIKPTGIIHVGAHLCEERKVYHDVGLSDDNILWIEANPSFVEHVKKHHPNINVIQAVISDKEESVRFMITNNGQSSSFLPFGTHQYHHPYVYASQYIELRTQTLTNLVHTMNIDVCNYNMLIMDIQGAELHALKGAADLLPHFKHIYLEVNEEEVYQGCGLFTEVRAFLLEHGFVLRDKVMTEWKWGDALFVRDGGD